MRESARAQRLVAYLVGIAAAAFATGLRWLLQPTIGDNAPYALVLPAIVVSAVLGGLGPALVTAVLGGLAADLWFVQPHGQIVLTHPVEVLRFGIVLAIAAVVGLLAERMRQMGLRLRMRTRELNHTVSLLRAVNETTTDLLFVKDRASRLLLANPALLRTIGRSAPEVIGRRDVEWHRDAGQAEALMANDRKVIETGQAQVVEEVVTTEQGTRVYQSNKSPLRDENGRIIGTVGLSRDVTERKQVERATAWLASIVSSSNDAIVSADLDGRIQSWNRGAERMFGYSEAETLGHSVAMLVPDGEDDPIRPLKEVAQGRQFERLEARRRRKDGQIIDISLTLSAIRDAHGNVVGVSKIARDITDRKRLEESLRCQTASLRLLSEAGTRLLVSDRPRDSLRDIFDALADHLKVDFYFNYLVAEDGQSLQLHACRGLDKGAAQPIERLQFGQEVCGTVAQQERRIILERVHESTEEKTALLRGLGIRCYACHPLMQDGLLGTISFGATDRDQYTQEELGLMQAVADLVAMALGREKLVEQVRLRAAALEEANRAKDHFLAVLSHELRTPLTPVLALAQLMERDATLAEEVRSSAAMMRRNVEMEARLIDDLLDLTRIARGKITLSREDVEIDAVLKRAVEVCRPDLEARRLHLSMKLDDDRAHVRGDAGRLQQVFWNLLRNAIKFTPEDGCIGIRTARADGQVLVEVVDSGAGIEPQAMGRIFEAFEQGDRWITRRFGGLGVGLAISKSLVTMHGGMISAVSEGRGRGATFRVSLPVSSAAAIEPPSRDEAPSPAEPRRPLRLLLVEDHADTARILRRYLQSEGYQVSTAGDVASALRLIDSEPFDLLLSDLGLPDGSGLDVMRHAKTHARTPGIALSGFGLEEDLRKSREAGFSAHLTKPINVGQLQEAIQSISAARAGASDAH